MTNFLHYFKAQNIDCIPWIEEGSGVFTLPGVGPYSGFVLNICIETLTAVTHETCEEFGMVCHGGLIEEPESQRVLDLLRMVYDPEQRRALLEHLLNVAAEEVVESSTEEKRLIHFAFRDERQDVTSFFIEELDINTSVHLFEDGRIQIADDFVFHRGEFVEETILKLHSALAEKKRREATS